MGWEWHNRKRNRKGRFEGVYRSEQLHIRVTALELERIRAYANARQMDISEYIRDLVQRDRIRAEYGIELPENG